MLSIVFNLLLAARLVWGTVNLAIVKPGYVLFDQELYTNVLDPDLCSQHLAEMDAFNFYDVSFRIPQGISRGNVLNFGLYQQCLDLRQEITEDNVIEEKHCMINVPWSSLSPLSVTSSKEIHPIAEEVSKQVIAVRQQFSPKTMFRPFDSQILPNNHETDNQVLIFKLGVCIPKSCSVRQAIDQYLNNTIVSTEYEEFYCRLPNDRPYVVGDYMAIVIFSMIGLVTIISTSYDLLNIYILKNDPKNVNKLYTCCSVYSNSRRLFTFGPTRGTITCLDGIRSISILWIVMGHAMGAMIRTGFTNQLDYMEWQSSPNALWFNGMNISVDSFFMMSGLLLVYSITNKQIQNTFLKKLHLYYLNRYLRMFPVVAIAVLFQATLMFHISDGFDWISLASHTFLCQRYWWSALLHVQNYVNPDMVCHFHLWYLSVDFQLHILSPLVIYWVLGNRRQGWTAVTVALMASLTASTIYCYLTDFKASYTAYNSKYYVNTLTRAPPFFVGVFFGYLHHVYRGKKLPLSKMFIIFSWICSLTLLSLTIYVRYPLMTDNNEMLEDFLIAFHRTIWAIGLGIMTFVCNHGYGGPINWFLSLTVWKFISRISFAIYVMHYPIQFIRMGNAIAPHYFSENNILLHIMGDIVLTLMVSIVLTVVFEAPFTILVNILLNKGPRKEADVGIVNRIPNDITTKIIDKKGMKKASYDTRPRKEAFEGMVNGTPLYHYGYK